MNLNNIDYYIKHGHFLECCKQEFSNEVTEYINRISSNKDSIFISGEFDPNWNFNRNDLISLLTYYLNDKLYEWDMEYIMSILDLHYENDDNKIEEVLFNFSDAYLGYPINIKNVEQTIAYLLDKLPELNLKSEKSKKLRENYKSLFVNMN